MAANQRLRYPKRILIRKGILICVLFIAIFIIAWYFYSRNSVSPVRSASVKEESVDPRSSLIVANKPAADLRPTVLKPIQSFTVPEILQKFNSSTNGREFVHSYWNRPELGGWYYASKMVDQCNLVVAFQGASAFSQPDIAKVGQESYLKAAAALRRLQDRCSQFTVDEFTNYAGKSVFSRKDANLDPLIAAEKLLLSETSGDQSKRLSAVQAVLATRDPLVADDVGMRLSIFRDSQGTYLYLNGEKQYIRDEPPLVAAYYLLPCGLGLACDATDVDLMSRCISGAGCYENRFDRVRIEMSNQSSKKYD